MPRSERGQFRPPAAADVDEYARDQIRRTQVTVAPIHSGTGTPEGVVTAGIGSIFLRSDGGAATTFYVKETGTGNTGWVGK